MGLNTQQLGTAIAAEYEPLSKVNTSANTTPKTSPSLALRWQGKENREAAQHSCCEGTAGGVASPSASAVHGPSSLSAANNHARMVSQGGGKRNRRTERNGKLVMMSQDFSSGLQKAHDFGQRGSQRRVKHQMKALQPHIQISDQ